MINNTIYSKEFNINDYKELVSFNRGICIISGENKRNISKELLNSLLEEKDRVLNINTELKSNSKIRYEDKNVVLITEIKDEETLRVAVEKSKLGKLVLSTFGFKANNIRDIFNKLNDFNIEDLEDELKSLSIFKYKEKKMEAKYIVFNNKEDYLELKNENEEIFRNLRNGLDSVLLKLENFNIDNIKNIVSDNTNKIKKELDKSEEKFERDLNSLLNLPNNKLVKKIEDMEMPNFKSLRKKQEIIESTKQYIINELKKGNKDE